MKFDPFAPFPPLDPESASYEDVKAHAREFDKWLGLRMESVEAEVREAHTLSTREEAEAVLQMEKLSESREFWLSKPVDTFMTPYWDLDHMLREAGVAAGDLVVDLGAGYARLAFVLALRYPNTGFIGIEKIRARLDEASRVLKSRVLNENPLFSTATNDRCHLLAADLRELDIASLNDPLADSLAGSLADPMGPGGLRAKTVAARERTHFFIYDFGSREDIQIVLTRLQDLARVQQTVVLARGGRSRELIDREHPWLSQVQKPKHFARFSIYRS